MCLGVINNRHIIHILKGRNLFEKGFVGLWGVVKRGTWGEELPNPGQSC